MPTSDVLKSPLRRDDRCSAVADKLARIPKANSQCYPGPTAFEPPTDSHLVLAVEHLENTPRVLPPCETADMPDEVRKRIFLGRNPAPNAYHHPELATQFLAMLPRRQAMLAGLFAKLLRCGRTSLRYVTGSTLELRCRRGKHESPSRPSHHCRVFLSRGGQGYRRVRGSGLEAGFCRSGSRRAGRLTAVTLSRETTERVTSSSSSCLKGQKLWILSRINCTGAPSRGRSHVHRCTLDRVIEDDHVGI